MILKTIGAIVAVIAGIALMIVLAFGIEMGGLKWKGYFAPKHAAVERQVFKETRSFNEAKLQELTKARLEYLREKDPIVRQALASTIRHQFADYDSSKLPPELASFLNSVRYSTNGQ